MARKMDKYVAHRDSMKAIDKQIAEQNKILRDLKAQRDAHEAIIMKVMRTSVEGTIDGHVAFKLKTSERNTATIARVREFAPEVQDKIIQKTVSRKIEVV